MSAEPRPQTLPPWWVAQSVDPDIPAPRSARGRALVVIAQALFTSAAGPPPPARLRWLIAEFNDFQIGAGLKARLLMGVSTALATWLAPLRIRRLPPLSRLSAADRIDALDSLESSLLGTPLFALKAILSLLYYEHPDAADELGFDGRSLLEWQP